MAFLSQKCRQTAAGGWAFPGFDLPCEIVKSAPALPYIPWPGYRDTGALLDSVQSGFQSWFEPYKKLGLTTSQLVMSTGARTLSVGFCSQILLTVN